MSEIQIENLRYKAKELKSKIVFFLENGEVKSSSLFDRVTSFIFNAPTKGLIHFIHERTELFFRGTNERGNRIFEEIGEYSVMFWPPEKAFPIVVSTYKNKDEAEESLFAIAYELYFKDRPSQDTRLFETEIEAWKEIN